MHLILTLHPLCVSNSSGITNLTTCQDIFGEFMASVVESSVTEYDYNSASPKAKIKTNNMTGTNGHILKLIMMEIVLIIYKNSYSIISNI